MPTCCTTLAHLLHHPDSQLTTTVLCHPCPLQLCCTREQIGTAVAVLAITAVQLAGVDSWQGLLNQRMCKASADPTNLQVCTYIYAVGGVSIVMTILIGLLQVRRAARVSGCAGGDVRHTADTGPSRAQVSDTALPVVVRRARSS